jgi:hypothetical protein
MESIRPEPWMSVYWTMVLSALFFMVGSAIAGSAG